ncbi:urea transporter [Bacillus sp. JJ1521]|uniref:urea transporter n=1 Tax=Bacillus sp. JJ1521 TaxID=3122957 RepID=UPI002FFEDA86
MQTVSLKEHWLVNLLKATLNGISQVVLIENPITGFIFLLAITISSYSLGIVAFLSALIGTLIAKIAGGDEEAIDQGLFGFNSVLTGMALTLFLNEPYHWMIALFGAAVAVIFTAAMMHFMKNLDIPVLTFPYIILTWFFLLTSYRLKAFKLSSDLVPQSLAHWELTITGEINWAHGIFNGIGQIFFLDTLVPGFILFVGVFWASWRLGLYAIIGNMAALAISLLLGGEYSLIFSGLYGYNAILTIIAVSKVFIKDNHPIVLLSGIIAACLTVPIAASVISWLLPFGLPALTMPFVLCTWLLLAARKFLPKL